MEDHLKVRLFDPLWHRRSKRNVPLLPNSLVGLQIKSLSSSAAARLLASGATERAGSLRRPLQRHLLALQGMGSLQRNLRRWSSVPHCNLRGLEQATIAGRQVQRRREDIQATVRTELLPKVELRRLDSCECFSFA